MEINNSELNHKLIKELLHHGEYIKKDIDWFNSISEQKIASDKKIISLFSIIDLIFEKKSKYYLGAIGSLLSISNARDVNSHKFGLNTPVEEKKNNKVVRELVAYYNAYVLDILSDYENNKLTPELKKYENIFIKEINLLVPQYLLKFNISIQSQNLFKKTNFGFYLASESIGGNENIAPEKLTIDNVYQDLDLYCRIYSLNEKKLLPYLELLIDTGIRDSIMILEILNIVDIYNIQDIENFKKKFLSIKNKFYPDINKNNPSYLYSKKLKKELIEEL